MIKAILFDLDNTLIDFMRVKRTSCEAAVEAMISSGVRMDKEKALGTLYKLYDKYGYEHQLIFQKFLKKANRKIDYGILAAGIVAYRRVQAGAVEPYAGVVPTLIRLKEKGLKLGIVSDAPKLKAWIRLVEMRIQDFFDAVVCFEDTMQRKPSRLPFEKAIQQMGIRPEECLMVGDWPERDIEGAKALGMRTVFARYGAMAAVRSSGADYEIDSIGQLLQVVAKNI